MRKIDKLVLDAFIGPFIITFLVVVFILLNINMLKYFDDIIGKGLGAAVLGQLFFYFAVFTVPTAMPLAVLLSSLIAFGNLGEHFELTALKSAGISLVRALLPIFVFVVMLTFLAFYINNNLVPKAALEAYSLLYDIKQKKPALELREGVFYHGIDNISIKVAHKFPKDEQALKGVIVYDHRRNDGNKEVTIADSGRMYTILNDRYLKFELYNGYRYTQGSNTDREVTGQQNNPESFSRSKFSKTQVVFDMSSFQLGSTDKKWFQGNRIMRNIAELSSDIDSINLEILNQELTYYVNKQNFFTYYMRGDSLVLPEGLYEYRRLKDSLASIPYQRRYNKTAFTADSAKRAQDSVEGQQSVSNVMHMKDREERRKILLEGRKKRTNLGDMGTTVPSRSRMRRKDVKFDSAALARIDSLYKMAPTRDIMQGATNQARQINNQVANANSSVQTYRNDLQEFQVQWHKIPASSFACIAMFLIGAPLGAIIKKGGLGVPFLVSIFFFICYYVLTMQGEKLGKQGTVNIATGVWAADFVLLIIGLLFLRQARADARLFEADFYAVVLDKVKRWFASRKATKAQHA